MTTRESFVNPHSPNKPEVSGTPAPKQEQSTSRDSGTDFEISTLEELTQNAESIHSQIEWVITLFNLFKEQRRRDPVYPLSSFLEYDAHQIQPPIPEFLLSDLSEIDKKTSVFEADNLFEATKREPLEKLIADLIAIEKQLSQEIIKSSKTLRKVTEEKPRWHKLIKRIAHIQETGASKSRFGRAEASRFREKESVESIHDLTFGLDGQYTVLEKIGYGGTADAWLATRTIVEAGTEKKDLVVIKALASQFVLGEDPETKEDFLAEANILQKLDPKHFPRYFDSNGVVIVMEYINGKSLADVHQYDEHGKKPLPLAQAVSIAKDVAEGMAVAHSKNITHNDLSHRNIMVAAGGTAKIIDLGLAKDLNKPPKRGAIGVDGTLGYLSPERLGRQEPAAKSDVFVLGILLYEMATGKKPFPIEESPTDEQVNNYARKVFTGVFVPAKEIDAQIPEKLDTLITQMLAPKPAERPTMQQIEESLKNIEPDIKASEK